MSTTATAPDPMSATGSIPEAVGAIRSVSERRRPDHPDRALVDRSTDPFHPAIRDAWLTWLHSPRGRSRYQSWAERHRSLQSWRPADLADPPGGERTDRMQASMVALAQGGEAEPVFGLAVQLRPGLLGVVRAARRALGSEADAEVWSAFTETVYRHPLQRRPARIAANLVLDTRHLVTVARSRPPGLALGPVDGPGPAPDARRDRDHGRRSELLEAVDQLRRAADRLPGDDRSRRLTTTVAYRAWFLDEPHELIARHLGIGPRSVASRLHRIRGPLRDLLATDLDGVE